MESKATEEAAIGGLMGSGAKRTSERRSLGTTVSAAAFAAGAATFSVLAASPASAQTSQQLDAARRLFSGVQQVVAESRLRATVADLSAPLVYESRLGPVDPSRPGDPRLMDVAGVRAGMSPEEAGAALRAGGFEPPRDHAWQPSYDTEVRGAWRTATGALGGRDLKVPASETWRRTGEEVYVQYEALPQGARVVFVTYTADPKRVSEEAFAAQLARRYGAPANEGEDMRWCTLKAPECERPQESEFPVLQANASRRLIFLSGRDADRAAALKARFDADVASRSAPPVQASF